MKPITLPDILVIKSALRRHCEDHMRSVNFFALREQEDMVQFHQAEYDAGARMYDVFEEVQDRLMKSESLRTSISVKL